MAVSLILSHSAPDIIGPSAPEPPTIFAFLGRVLQVLPSSHYSIPLTTKTFIILFLFYFKCVDLLCCNQTFKEMSYHLNSLLVRLLHAHVIYNEWMRVDLMRINITGYCWMYSNNWHLNSKSLSSSPFSSELKLSETISWDGQGVPQWIDFPVFLLVL